jgi:hypothetical protein
MPDAEKRPEPAETRPFAGALGTADRILSGLAVVAALLIFVDAFYDTHGKFTIEGVFGFYGLFGFIACVVLVAVAKALLGPMRRPDDHYERDAGDGG